MIFGDYSPPAIPTLDQQRDALQKGLGRAMLWAKAGRLADGPLLAACLQDQRHDRQCEDYRIDWLWSLIEATGARDRFRVPILHALYDLGSGDSEYQLCGLAGHYAVVGDQTFRAHLYELVERKPDPDMPSLGESELIDIDGEEGFAFAARLRGQSLTARDWDWPDGSLVRDSIEKLGEKRVGQLLENSSDDAIAAFARAWQQSEREETVRKSSPPSYLEEMRAFTVAEVIAKARGAGNAKLYLRSWGKYAEPADLETVLVHLRAESDPDVLANLLQVFQHRALPEFDSRLLELCRHGDEPVRRRAFTALKANRHPQVRQFALDEIRRGAGNHFAIELLAANFESGDESTILDALDPSANACDWHWQLMSVIRILEANPDADASQLGFVVYGGTPCENCRGSIVDLLKDRNIVPDWMAAECRHDSYETTRKVFEESSDSNDTNG